MSSEVLLWIYFSSMVLIQWLQIGNDVINLHMDREYFEEIKILEELEEIA